MSDPRNNAHAKKVTQETLSHQSNGEVGNAMLPRNLRQFGTLLPDANRPNAGIGPKLVLDNYYLAFPNLYAIRGTPYRDVRKWRDSVDVMIAEGPEFLVPSHARPLAGRAHIKDVLTDYRNAIHSVYSAVSIDGADPAHSRFPTVPTSSRR